MSFKKRILILYTGGTIGMKKGENGRLVPCNELEDWINEDIKHLENRMVGNGEIKDMIPTFEFKSMKPLLDSSDMNPNGWNRILDEVKIGLSGKKFAGILILHGTDTMAFTGSALAFMLKGFHHLEKSVVITGSQIPYAYARTDARDQLISAMILTATAKIKEVVLFFNNNAYRACRTTKIDCNGFGAFDSPNHPVLGHFGISFNHNENLNSIWEFTEDTYKQGSYHDAKFHSLDNSDFKIGLLKLFPGIDRELIRFYLNNYDGLVIEAFGSGNGPEVLRKELMEDVLDKMVVVLVTQCFKGKLSKDAYDAGIFEGEVVDGRDMTTEAAFTKLHYLFSVEEGKVSKIRERMGRPMAGEMWSPKKTPNYPYRKYQEIQFSGATAS